MSEAAEAIWVPLADEDRNCDWLPENISPGQGCPVCGSAWVSVTAAAFKPPPVLHGTFRASDCRIVPHLPAHFVVRGYPISAVRLECFQDHLVEYDGSSLRQISYWATSVMAPALLGMAAAAAYLIGFKGAAR
jgi:hypothetical protein